MVSEKIVRFQNKNKDLNQLAQQIITMLNQDGYKTQITSNSPVGIIIQATKAGILRDIITADRAFTIMITQNIAVIAAEALLLSALFLAVDIPEMLWTRHVEGEILHRITQMIG